MFDDVQSNCHKVQASGVNCYLIATKYNRSNRNGLKVVNNWEELYKVGKEMEIRSKNNGEKEQYFSKNKKICIRKKK